MSYELNTLSTSGATLCSYGDSKLLVRGPERKLDQPFLAFLGSTETFGRFVETPFAAKVEQLTKLRCVNLAAINGGLDSFHRDEGLCAIAAQAEGLVLQVMGAQNISNEFYSVHPRRNDRFLRAHPRLTELYPEVDFTEFHFNKHMLTLLEDRSAERFEQVKTHLQQVWLQRMEELLERFAKPVLLLWLRYDLGVETEYSQEPVLVEQHMIDALENAVEAVVPLDVQTALDTGDIGSMIYGQLELPTARLMLGPATHRKIAEEIASYFE
ncbi:hypothetical protein SAMN04488118_110140 [Epibacterium ulvae]|uniref:DUF6473 domain-containing protein n=1 Tax=Epibacterium ulvae TaxID=1156985 RepID=A0A1G5R922_9RHOB|nr:DUF6473 family protein [Epibacterium ulvae]SCZ70496.1 hypothetical protein SAMN04488118_110140 [Epibacterium ulvae]